MATGRIPEGFHTLSPHIIVSNAAEAIDFYTKAFGAEEIMRMNGPDGSSVMHAELKIGDSRLMLAGEFPDYQCFGPQHYGGSSVTLHLYVTDVDAAWQRAVEAGAEEVFPLTDQFWGDRYGKLRDPYGHIWGLATQNEVLTPEQCMERAAKAFGGCQ